MSSMEPEPLPDADAKDKMLDLRILRLLAEKPEMTQRELAKAVGVSLGQANFIVRALLGRGWVKVENFRRSNNKLGYLYVLTPHGIAHRVRLTQAFITRKEIEYDQLRSEIEHLRTEINRF